MTTPATPAQLGAALRDSGYIADPDIATACFLAMELDKPLLCEGAPGVGKTSLARALAHVTGGPLIRLQCYEGLDSTHALYDWDFAAQILHVRTLEAQAKTGGSALSSAALEDGLYQERFLLERPVLQALRAGGLPTDMTTGMTGADTTTTDTTTAATTAAGTTAAPAPRPVLLIDELDRADDEFDALLLEVLSDWSVTIPELGTVRAAVPPLVVLTSNRTRELHDALKRRCLYHWFATPTPEQERQVLGMHVPNADADLRDAVVRAAGRLRAADLAKPPGTAETIDWLRALSALHVSELDAEAVRTTLSAVIKDAQDLAPATAALEDFAPREHTDWPDAGASESPTAPAPSTTQAPSATQASSTTAAPNATRGASGA